MSGPRDDFVACASSAEASAQLLEEMLLTTRGNHLQLRAMVLALRHVIDDLEPDVAHFDNLAAVANAACELDVRLALEESALMTRIQRARGATYLH